MSTFLRNAAAAVQGGANGTGQTEAPAPAVVDFPLAAISDDDTAQIRVLPSEKVTQYAQAMAEPELLAEFPPVLLYEDPASGVIRISQGFTRIAAARQAGLTTFRAIVRRGGAREAFVGALGSNARHGDPRTNADLLYELDRVLKDPELARWSDREIARRVHCSHKTVGARRRFWVEQGEIEDDGTRLRTDKHGNVSAITVANITAANAARASAARVLDEVGTYKCIQRGLGQQEPGLQARYDWLRAHDAPGDYAFVLPAGWVLDERTFAGAWQRAHDELYTRLPKPKAQPTPQPAAQPRFQPAAQPNFVSATAPRTAAWSERGRSALTNLSAHLRGVLEELPAATPYVRDAFDGGAYKVLTQTLLAKVNDLLEGMGQEDGEGKDEDG